ncbi:MAG: cellulase family glycosylhydrolase, partial [Bacteroidales bacterium]|nr:cellulase family glycosylhydrolase [Bacteroidales bacterium]
MRIRILTFIAALALICPACGKNKEADVTPVRLSANPAELVFDAKGGTQQLTITSGIKPTVSCQDAWVSLGEGTYSANNYSLKVSAQENTGTTERTAYIRVIGDKQSMMVAVMQKVAEVELTADKTSVSFDRFGGETVVTVTSSTQPSASTDANWCLVQTGTIGSDKTTAITVAAPASRNASAQSGTLTVTCGNKKLSIPLSLEAYQQPETASATAVTPEMVFEAMAPGWNMGNHMDAISNDVASETAWGNVKATQATLDGVKAAGFKAVRICVTWQGHIGEAPAYRLDEKWLGRVEEIVGYAEKAGLVAIVYTHHDESYWLEINKASEKTKDMIFSVWT